ncbi:hypothetical protein FB451DRAFT_1188018 [Mycena latifolia]|nr:hypothetical protein FB451DRAFT_1188018 [Mycena latifolia]
MLVWCFPSLGASDTHPGSGHSCMNPVHAHLLEIVLFSASSMYYSRAIVLRTPGGGVLAFRTRTHGLLLPVGGGVPSLLGTNFLVLSGTTAQRPNALQAVLHAGPGAFVPSSPPPRTRPCPPTPVSTPEMPRPLRGIYALSRYIGGTLTEKKSVRRSACGVGARICIAHVKYAFSTEVPPVQALPGPLRTRGVTNKSIWALDKLRTKYRIFNKFVAVTSFPGAARHVLCDPL